MVLVHQPRSIPKSSLLLNNHYLVKFTPSQDLSFGHMLQSKDMERKSHKIWVTLIVLPIPLMLITFLLLAVIKAVASPGQGSGVMIVVNIIALLIGVAAVLMLLGIPVWIIMLLEVDKHNKKLDQATTPPSTPGKQY